jgi:hypothetical protein
MQPERAEAAEGGGPASRESITRFLPTGVALLLAIGEVPVVRGLIVPDPNWCYPFVVGDSYDWINNGLFWAGAHLRPSFRPPGLPLVIAVLARLGALPLLPVLNFAALGAVAVVLYHFLRERHTRLVACGAAVILFTNGFSQDHARYLMAEIYATAFLVAAAWAFHRAADAPRAYRAMGLLLGAGFLFHYAAVPAGIGFLAAMVLARRFDLRRRELWHGVFLAAIPAVLWLAVRAVYQQTHPDVGHPVERLLGFALGRESLRFYVIAGTALLGLALLPLYGSGLLRLVGDRALVRDRFRIAYLAPLVSLLGFFLLLYRWVDKRFLFYAFPFAVCLLAEGLELLVRYSRRNLAARAVAVAFAIVAFAWNCIQYPHYGIQFLALTPRDFLEVRAGWHLEGATLKRLHPTYAGSFTRGLFDFRSSPPACDLSTEEYRALPALRAALDARLAPGKPIGFFFGGSWPADGWSAVNRLSNEILRPVAPGMFASPAVALTLEPGKQELFRVGPYHVIR